MHEGYTIKAGSLLNKELTKVSLINFSIIDRQRLLREVYVKYGRNIELDMIFYLDFITPDNYCMKR